MARFKLRQQRLRSPFFKTKKNSNNNGQGSIQKIDRAPSSPEFAAQNLYTPDLSECKNMKDVWNSPTTARLVKLRTKTTADADGHHDDNDSGEDRDNNAGGGDKNKKKGGGSGDGEGNEDGGDKPISHYIYPPSSSTGTTNSTTMARVKLSQFHLRSPFFKKEKNSNNNNGQGSIQKIDTAPSSAEFAAQNSAELGSSGAGSDEPARTLERPRLPKKFLHAVAHLGIKNAVPKTIMQLRNDDGDSNGGGGNKNKKLDSYLELRDLSSPKLNFALEDVAMSDPRRVKVKKCGVHLIYGADLDIDADNDGGDADNDDGDDRDNNGSDGDKNKKKGGGSGGGEGNGDGGDKAEGGDGEKKGMNKDCTGQLGFSYRCTYHAGYENGYPVGQLHALIMFYLFCSENMTNYCSITLLKLLDV